jgi:hypothetical protein
MSPISRILAAAAVLSMTAVGVTAATAQNYSQAPTYGTVALRSGFTPDPYSVSLQAGGSTNAAQSVGGSCTGFIATAPDYRLNYTAGSLPLIISVNAGSDTTLVVNGPDGSWYCDDDGGNSGMNPSLRWGTPPTGQYDIWVGTFGSATLVPATLQISELTSN